MKKNLHPLRRNARSRSHHRSLHGRECRTTTRAHTSEAFTNRSYLAYFSAPWCTHCETTLDAYDLTVPAEQLVVFSRDGREEYANMSEWHNNTEANLNRTVHRPFILHPDLAMEVEAKSIPHAVFVNPQGYAFHVEIGKGNQPKLHPIGLGVNRNRRVQ